MRILVTGATGYIGGRLIPRLLEQGHQITVLVRNPARLLGRSWAEKLTVITGDVQDTQALQMAIKDQQACYYLVHSMMAGSDFAQRDRDAANQFGSVAAALGVQQIIYLGGLGNETQTLSLHMRSRHETGRALRAGGVPVTEFRAGAIIGSGSLSFEMLRYLCECIPVMVLPRWTRNLTQPIAIRDVMSYLIAALDNSKALGQIIEIGAPAPMSFTQMMHTYHRVRGLKRLIIPAPVLTPYLSGFWVQLVTPIPAAIARPIIMGAAFPSVKSSDLADRIFPDIKPIETEMAMRLALDRYEKLSIETSWTSALSASPHAKDSDISTNREGMLVESRRRVSHAQPQELFFVIERIGGNSGWYHANWLWRIRGVLDKLVGGVGLRRGRRDPCHLTVGDALDFWRVEAVEAGSLLRLRAEMLMPGHAWLQFEVQPHEAGSQLIQTAFYEPRGLFGLIYWWSLYPFHKYIFGGMANSIVNRAE